MTTGQPPAVTPDVAVESCDVCIVGAGVAGLNALFVASQYLASDQKVILVDRRPRVGGMWVDTYPYVRLHQPHPMFTAGNIEWTLGKERSYLATQCEVLDHFAHCLDVLKERVRVDEYFGWEVESHDEAAGTVRVTCSSADGRRLVIETNRLIKAYGFAPQPNDPLELSSARVHSVSPNYCDMRGDDMRASDAPVWIIGGGKTAMDTAHALITEYPGREVNLVAGSGTYFLSRERILPTGAARWWRGQSFNGLAMAVTQRFDGTNEDVVNAWFRDTYGLHLTPQTGNFLLGLMSESENRTIAAGLDDVVMDHLDDVVDRNGDTHLVFRSGATKAIRPGSWIVNCTGYFKYDDRPYEPYISPSGAVLSINPRSITLQLTTFMGYFMTHLMMLGNLRDIPLYELDAMELRHKANPAFPMTLFTLAMHNISLITEHAPRKVFSQCGIDVNRWYPMPRRALSLAQFMLTHRREREHLRRSLDTVRERFDVRCGPLDLGVRPEPVKQ
ncbi:potassium transporter [Mycobacteriaceae bacterium 1482268.1]|nr:potassium transporter [Mycobacteriaceae bacterium 1482268.1]